MLYVGCAVWAYDGWANSFYPQGLAKDERLHAYARRLTAVEGNSTFYAVPPVQTVKKWTDDTPESFKFCPKFPKAITHTARLKDVRAQTGVFLGAMRVLGPRLGPLMLQLPPTFGPNQLGVLTGYLDTLPDDVEIAVEVRRLDWFEPANSQKLDKALAQYRAARIVFDSRPAHNSADPEAQSAKEKKPKAPVVAEATQPFVVLRYISSPVIAENDPYLDTWAERIAGWLSENRRVYFFAHCPVEELSPGFARDLYHRVSKLTDLPPLPWDEVEAMSSPKDLTQLSLF